MNDKDLKELLLEVFYLIDYHGGKICVEGNEYGPVHFAHALDTPLIVFMTALKSEEKPWVPTELKGNG